MATNEITARATLQGDIRANVTLGVPVEVYVDREIYDGETEITPTEEDITLETAGKAVLDDILVHGVEPKDPNIFEGTFQTDTAGVLTIDLPYSGESYAKAISIYDADGIHEAEPPRAYTMTAYCAYKNNAQDPTYDGDTANNGYRYQIVYTGATTYTSTAGSPAYVCTQADPVLGVTNCIKMPDNHTLKVYVSNATAGTSVRFRIGIKYKYQVIY